MRFHSVEAIDAKPINDDLQLDITGSLPIGFAYVFASLSWRMSVDLFGDFLDVVGFRIFNGIPTAPNGNEQWALLNLTDFQRNPSTGTKTLEYTRGGLREWFPLVLSSPGPSQAMSFTLAVANPADPASAAGTQEFHAAFYQYELNQAVRFPLNFPLPVGVR